MPSRRTAAIGQLFSMNARFLGALAPMSRVVDGNGQAWPPTVERLSYMADAWRASARWPRSGAQPYGPEHAYRSSRVRTIETRIDPAIPIPFEKNTNILQANSA
jgi:hypothetical protein